MFPCAIHAAGAIADLISASESPVSASLKSASVACASVLFDRPLSASHNHCQFGHADLHAACPDRHLACELELKSRVAFTLVVSARDQDIRPSHPKDQVGTGATSHHDIASKDALGRDRDSQLSARFRGSKGPRRQTKALTPILLT